MRPDATARWIVDLLTPAAFAAVPSENIMVETLGSGSSLVKSRDDLEQGSAGIVNGRLRRAGDAGLKMPAKCERPVRIFHRERTQSNLPALGAN